MTPRQAKLAAASKAVDNAKHALEIEFPRADLENPMLTKMQREVVAVRQMDVAALELASKTVMAVAADPDAFGMLMELRAKKPEGFEAIRVLAQIELERKAEAAAA